MAASRAGDEAGVAPVRAPPADLIRVAALGAVLALAYGLAARLETQEFMARGFSALLGLPAGIAFAGLALGGRRLWPAVTIGALAAHLSLGMPPASAVGLAALAALEAWLGVTVFRAIQDRECGLERVRDVLSLAAAAFLSALIGAAAGAKLLLAAGETSRGDFGQTALALWFVDAIGVLIVTPLGLAWQGMRPRFRTSRMIEAALMLAVLLLTVQTVTGQWWGSAVRGNLRPYAVFPIVVWAALRFGIRGVVIANSMLLAFMSWHIVDDPLQSATLGELFFRSEAFLAAITLTDLLLAAALAERDRAAAALARSHDGLEQRVRERTLELQRLNENLVREIAGHREAQANLEQSEFLLGESQRMSGVGSWAWDPATDRWTLSEELYRIFGWQGREFPIDTGMFLGHVHPPRGPWIAARPAGRGTRSVPRLRSRVPHRARGRHPAHPRPPRRETIRPPAAIDRHRAGRDRPAAGRGSAAAERGAIPVPGRWRARLRDQHARPRRSGRELEFGRQTHHRLRRR
ncbi:MAG: hypothetical protein E6K80_06515 [Candidatus Eisenbacteria bacterium]|uniref:MASE1 domain-containing protein n=1 Tax=Eiseniibacteriota bacterium TaxID=2212470 RepID=A0A538U5E3_UNCEI|nr:MAG: hypothetical protein E6K80_06515 [Candidatus Eisenbacteria bacterium]